jgi:CRISPR/Cas system endoribonuclease Cas6 (RAMP superfamily)
VASYFLSLFGRSDRVTACACERMGEVTLPQLLHLQNGDELPKKIRSTDGRLAALLKEKDDGKVIQELFLATVSRLPRDTEMKTIQESLKTGDPREEVYRDLFWALLNSKDFAFNH